METHLKEILEKVTEMMKPHPVYAVGGCCRDYILGNEPKDYDFCTPATPEEIEAKIKASKNEHGDGRKVYGIGRKFGTLGCKFDKQMVEITTFRSEEYEPGNRKPKVEYVTNLNEDLSRRDFTINAMAIRLTKGHIKIIDPYCGQEDLEKGIIRAVGHPKQRFKEDPLRILRAVRFSCRFKFLIEDDTLKKMKRMAIHLLDISKERWMMELDKILVSDFADSGLVLLWTSDLFKFMIPELHLQWGYNQNSEYHNFDLAMHTINVVQATPKDDLNLRWAALLHDIAKPFVRTKNPKGHSNYIGHEILGADMVRKISTHLKWDNERSKVVVNLIENHLKDSCPLREFDNMGKKKEIKREDTE